MARTNLTKLISINNRKIARRTLPSVTKKSIKDKIEQGKFIPR